MEYDLLVEGNAVTPQGTERVQIAVSDGRIAEIRKQGLRGTRKIAVEGSLVFPGFIDAHVHLREPGWEYKEDFASGTEAAVHGGVTTVLDMPNNPTPATTINALERKTALAREKALVDVKFFGGVGDNLAQIQRIRRLVVGYKIYLASSTGNLLFPSDRLAAALAAVARTGKPLSLHCEEQSIIDQRTRELVSEDRPDVHADRRPPEAEFEAVRKVLASLESGQARNARVNFCHISVAEALKIVSLARIRGMHVACEATLHHLFFSRKDMWKRRGLLDMNPPLRSEGDRRAMLEGLREGSVDFLVTDHAPHTLAEKRDGACGLPGLDNYGNMVAWLMRNQDVAPARIASVCSGNQARFFRLRDRGIIAKGKRADLTILDLKSKERASSSSVRSKCGWTPYEGYEFPGRVRWTIRAGAALLEDFEIV
jgi:dihydroorotase